MLEEKAGVRPSFPEDPVAEVARGLRRYGAGEVIVVDNGSADGSGTVRGALTAAYDMIRTLLRLALVPDSRCD